MSRSPAIVLTALAAILPMIALSRRGFLGSLVEAIKAGLIVATALIGLCLPARVAAWRSLGREEAGWASDRLQRHAHRPDLGVSASTRVQRRAWRGMTPLAVRV